MSSGGEVEAQRAGRGRWDGGGNCRTTPLGSGVGQDRASPFLSAETANGQASEQSAGGPVPAAVEVDESL